MPESPWTMVCRETDLEEGKPRLVKAGEDDVLVARVDGRVYAVANACPHYGCPLSDGTLFGNEIICACHDARFDVTSGRMLSAPSLKDLPLYPVRLEAGAVWLGPAQKPKAPKPAGTDSRTFLIVGAGAAGNAAAEMLRREGFAGRLVMVTAENDLPYDRPNLSKDFMSGEAKPEWMPLRSAKFYANQGIELLMNTRITAIDTEGRTASTEAGGTLSFDKALLATGATPRTLAVPGADGDAVFSLRSFADARSIAEAATGAARVVLIGSGFMNMELASSLRVRGLGVDLVAPDPQPLIAVVGERIASYLRKRHEGNGVAFHMGTTVTGISGGRGAKIVELSSGGRLTADFVVVAIGVQPAIGYLAGTDLVENGVVPVDGRLATKHPDIFAAGDIAAVRAPAGAEAVRSEHWVVAERQGQHAARSMLGSAAVHGEVPFFWTRQLGVSLRYVGWAREWDAVAIRGEVESGRFLAGYYRKGNLRAAASIGMSSDLAAVKILMGRGITLPEATLANPRVDLLALARG